ncbi:MAG: GFA family protein [Paracoccaceae bacterium]|nr:GFA family protein [Paracoccaceae bacterium]
MVEGRCLCGAVRFTVSGPMRPVVACHCVQCRKTSGHFVAATSAPRARVEIAGDVTWYASSPEARRGFCGTCGSSLFWDGGGSYLSIHAGALDGATGLALAGHIFVADKGDYYEITDGLPQFAAEDAAMTTKVP